MQSDRSLSPGLDDWRKVLACLGTVATVISGVQCMYLEYSLLVSYAWEGWDVILLGVYVMSLFVIYSVVPMILMASGATFLNLSLLTSDFWALLFGVTVGAPQPCTSTLHLNPTLFGAAA